MSSERRHFHRVILARPALCKHAQQEQRAALLDISLKGALLALQTDWQPQIGTQTEISVDLTGDGDFEIVMQATVRHVDGNHVGVESHHMDLDTATRLRRLVELNLGDPALLERELSQLLPGS